MTDCVEVVLICLQLNRILLRAEARILSYCLKLGVQLGRLWLVVKVVCSAHLNISVFSFRASVDLVDKSLCVCPLVEYLLTSC